MKNKVMSILLTLIMPVFGIFLLGLLLKSYLPSQASEDGTFVVNVQGDTNDGTCNAANCSLREAINAANYAPGTDTITFALPANTTITLGGTQLPNIADSLIIDGNTAVNLTISGNNASRIFVVGAPPPPYPRPGEGAGGSAALTLLNLTLRNGSEPLNQGGGIFNNGSLTIVNSTLRNFTSVNGGVFNSGILLVQNSAFSNNTATSRGGAIFNDIDAQATIVDSTFSGNSAIGPWATGGGAIYDLGGTIVISSSLFSMNTTTETVGIGARGGVIYSKEGSTISISGSTLSGNKASYWGGAIMSFGPGLSIRDSTLDGNSSRVGGAIGSFNGLTLTNSTLSNNSGQYGGAIHVEHGQMIVSNSTIAGNSAEEGGGIDSFFTDIYMNNSTLSHNSADPLQAGGVDVNNGSFNFSNSIIANSIGADCRLIFADGVNINNLDEDGTCAADFSDDPVLGNLLDNGGLTLTMLPMPGSPALENGDNATCETADQRGYPRPYDGDGDGTADCDIGAVEASDWFVFVPMVMKGP